MLVSGLACFCGAVATRRRLGIAASGLMLLAMLDLSLSRIVPPIVWAALLLIAGGALGGALRPRVDAPVGGWRIGRVAALAAALAYLCMAWLVVMHGAAAHAASPDGAGSAGAGAGHGGHGMGGSLGLIPFGLSALLALILAVIAVIAVRRRRRVLALEAGGMGVMLAAMIGAMLLG